MKKQYSVLFGLFLSVCVATPALAQDDEFGDSGDSGAETKGSPIEGTPYYFSPMFSYLKTDSGRGAADGYGLTLALGKKLTYGLNLELTGFFMQAGSDAPAGVADNGSLNLAGVGVTAMVAPLTSYPNFYALFSVARGGADGQAGRVSSYQSTVFDSGIGYLHPITPRMLLRLEARYHMDGDLPANTGAGAAGSNGDFYDGVFNAGVLIPLGSMEKTLPPAEEAPAALVDTASADSDNDGVLDDADQCPDTPAGAVVDEKGCEADADGDGVVDRLDLCADTPAGTAVGANGCADDADGDGVADSIDECPQTPAGAKVLANGCSLASDCRTPRAGEQVDEAGCAAGQAFVLKGVVFEYDSTRLTEEAKAILDKVAETLNAYPDVKVEIAGHTDSSGTDSYNLGLSERRSIAVKDYLTTKNVDAGRMTANGYGETQPIETNDTEEGRVVNRRVELRVIELGNAAAAPATEAATEEPATEAPAGELAPAEESFE